MNVMVCNLEINRIVKNIGNILILYSRYSNPKINCISQKNIIELLIVFIVILGLGKY